VGEGRGGDPAGRAVLPHAQWYHVRSHRGPSSRRVPRFARFQGCSRGLCKPGVPSLTSNVAESQAGPEHGHALRTGCMGPRLGQPQCHLSLVLPAVCYVFPHPPRPQLGPASDWPSPPPQGI
jgi:hypothetical protein